MAAIVGVVGEYSYICDENHCWSKSEGGKSCFEEGIGNIAFCYGLHSFGCKKKREEECC